MKKNISIVSIIALIILYAVCFMVCSCGSEENLPNAEDGSMRFTACYPGAEQQVKGLRATNTGFENDDVIGLYVTDATKPLQVSGNEVNNAAMTFDGTVWKPSNTVYWNNGMRYNVYAYYPYIASPASVDDCLFSVQTDQTTARSANGLGGYEASDFLWAERTGLSASKDPVALTFKHRMSRLNILLVTGEDYEGQLPDEKDIAVYVHNTVTEATVDMASGMVTKNPYKSATTIRAKSLGGYKYAAIVVPQRLDKNLPLVEVVMKGVSYLVESRFLFKMGMQHTIMLTISKNPEQVEIEIGGEIVDWDKDGN